ncbi:sigma-70 family RNA polymerase sigma factor [Bacillaceae bacterium S4-13-58]
MGENQKEGKLLDEISNGSMEAFHNFYEIYSPFVYQIALHILGDSIEAEDVCHDIFLEVFDRSTEYNSTRGSIKAWLAVKTKSRAIDRLRKKKPLLLNKLEDYLLKDEKSADTQALTMIENEIILDALKHLSKDQRDAIYASYFEGKSHREIASSMNRSLGTVKSFIRYGLHNLKKQSTLLGWLESSGREEKNGL